MVSRENSNPRIKSVDLLKGLVMVFIVFVHIFFLVPSTSEGSGRDVALPL